jgi:hypothetical protein
MINQIFNPWTTPSKGVQFLLSFLFHMFISTHHYEIMKYIGRYVVGGRWVGIVMTFLVRECYGSPKKQEF